MSPWLRRGSSLPSDSVGIRRDGREPDDLRTLAFTRDFTQFAAGSVLVEFGMTRVLCTASVEERVPPWLRGKGRGWVTAEYSMLPGSTSERNDARSGAGASSRAARRRSSGSSAGRCARSPISRCWARCRSPSTATSSRPTAAPAPRRSAVATSPCTTPARGSSPPRSWPRTRSPTSAPRSRSASSTALPYLDLDYSEDVRAEVDMNVVMTGEGRFVEVQGTAEGVAFSRSELDELLGLAESGITRIFALQREVLAEPPPPHARLDPGPRDRQPRQGRRDPGDAVGRGDRSRAVSRVPTTCPTVDETGTTLEENARLKAVALCEATGLPAIADDTGLEVDALDGAPGVSSARYAGRGRDLRRQRRQAARRAPRRRRHRAHRRASRPSPWPAGPTGVRWRRSATSRA